jgi:geranylgeranyl diphosphate synthase type II
MGKNTGKDRSRGKVTYPRILGMEESRRRVRELSREATGIAEEFGEAGRALEALTRVIVERTS